MGVPVLTLKGFNMNSRCGESINSNLGLNDFIADNFDDYYKKSISLQDKNKLSNLRSTLRNKILSSSLFDTDNFVKDLMSVFEKILKQ
jgi:predicted O-linked N-acetylglucosamine transferase (SPINDLY family)